MSAETLEFKAELKQLLHLITHSLYSDREIFLRELISNASDAINKVKFDSLENEERLEDNKDWKIKITPDAAANTLTISDNGIGMGREQVIDLLGTVAKSGTKAFVEAVKAKNDPNSPGLIGQFGVGFYSAFMVADSVTVHTRPAGSPADGIRWNSDGQGQYTIESAEKATRGTDVILHLKDDAKDFLNEYKLRSLVKKFSDFIEHPVVMDTEEEEGDGDDKKKVTVEETLNNRKAIWLRQPREVKEEEYAEFYKVLSNDDAPPAKTLHFTIEGKSEFKALLFIPSKKPFSFDWDEPKAGLRLYVQRVLIMERCEELLPLYLRFVKGVVDSADLPLNVSREILQQNPHLDTIRKNVVRNVLQGLEGLKNTNAAQYRVFYNDLGSILKEGLSRDWENKEKIAELLLFASVNTDAKDLKTLAEYVEAMPAGQEEIYYLAGDNAAQLRNSPYLEAYRAKGYDVLLLTDPIDEFAIPALREYKGKKLQAADKGELKSENAVGEDAKTKFAPLFESLKKVLPEVGDIRLTKRLTTSAACLVADAGAMTAHMERLMQRFGEDSTGAKRVLELNPDNAAVEALRTLHEKSPDDPRIGAYGLLLYDQAAIAEGSKVPDAAGFAKRINNLILTDLK